MKIGISACSNGHLPEWQDQITELELGADGESYKAECDVGDDT